MGQPLVDIIVPVYNAEYYLEKCLNSVLNQTYNNIRVLIINDGSTDKSATVIEKFCNSDDRCEIIVQDNRGIGGTRNVGLSNLLGEYFTFVDADDEIPPDYIESLIKKILEYDADIAIANVTDYNSSLLADINEELISVKDDRKKFYEKYVIKNHLYYCVTNKLFRYSSIAGIRFKESCNFGEDLLFLLDLYTIVEKIVIVKDTNYFYRYNPDSLTRKKNKRRCFEQYQICEAFYEFLLQNKCLEEIKIVLWELVWMFIISGITLSVKDGASHSTIIEFLNHVENTKSYQALRNSGSSLRGANKWVNIESNSFFGRCKLKCLIHIIQRKKWYMLKLLYR